MDLEKDRGKVLTPEKDRGKDRCEVLTPKKDRQMDRDKVFGIRWESTSMRQLIGRPSSCPEAEETEFYVFLLGKSLCCDICKFNLYFHITFK